MKSAIFSLLALLFSLPYPAHAEKMASEQCLGLFEGWATSVKTSLADELKAARALGIEKRSDPDATHYVETILSAARDLCARTSSFPCARPTPVTAARRSTAGRFRWLAGCVARGAFTRAWSSTFRKAACVSRLRVLQGPSPKAVP